MYSIKPRTSLSKCFEEPRAVLNGSVRGIFSAWRKPPISSVGPDNVPLFLLHCLHNFLIIFHYSSIFIFLALGCCQAFRFHSVFVFVISTIWWLWMVVIVCFFRVDALFHCSVFSVHFQLATSSGALWLFSLQFFFFSFLFSQRGSPFFQGRIGTLKVFSKERSASRVLLRWTAKPTTEHSIFICTLAHLQCFCCSHLSSFSIHHFFKLHMLCRC